MDMVQALQEIERTREILRLIVLPPVVERNQRIPGWERDVGEVARYYQALQRVLADLFEN